MNYNSNVENLEKIDENQKFESSLEYLKEVEKIVGLGNWVWEVESNELYCSDEIFKIFGTTPEEFDAAYENFLSFVHSDDRELVQSSVNLALTEKLPYNIDHRIVRPNSELRYVNEHGHVEINDEGKAVRMIGIVHDVSEVRKLQFSIKEERDLMQLYSILFLMILEIIFKFQSVFLNFLWKLLPHWMSNH